MRTRTRSSKAVDIEETTSKNVALSEQSSELSARGTRGRGRGRGSRGRSTARGGGRRAKRKFEDSAVFTKAAASDGNLPRPLSPEKTPDQLGVGQAPVDLKDPSQVCAAPNVPQPKHRKMDDRGEEALADSFANGGGASKNVVIATPIDGEKKSIEGSFVTENSKAEESVASTQQPEKDDSMQMDVIDSDVKRKSRQANDHTSLGPKANSCKPPKMTFQQYQDTLETITALEGGNTTTSHHSKCVHPPINGHDHTDDGGLLACRPESEDTTHVLPLEMNTRRRPKFSRQCKPTVTKQPPSNRTKATRRACIKGRGSNKRQRKGVENSPLASADPPPLKVDLQETGNENELEVEDAEADGDAAEISTNRSTRAAGGDDYLSTFRLSLDKAASEKQVPAEGERNERIDVTHNKMIHSEPTVVAGLESSSSLNTKDTEDAELHVKEVLFDGKKTLDTAATLSTITAEAEVTAAQSSGGIKASLHGEEKPTKNSFTSCMGGSSTKVRPSEHKPFDDDKPPVRTISNISSTAEEAKATRRDLRAGFDSGKDENVATENNACSISSIAKADSSRPDVKTCDSHKQLDDIKSIEKRVVPHPSTVTPAIEANSKGPSSTLTIRKKKRSSRELPSAPNCGSAAATTTSSQAASGSASPSLPTTTPYTHSAARVWPVSQSWSSRTGNWYQQPHRQNSGSIFSKDSPNRRISYGGSSSVGGAGQPLSTGVHFQQQQQYMKDTHQEQEINQNRANILRLLEEKVRLADKNVKEFRKSHLERTSRCAALKRVIKYIEGGMSGVQALQSALLLTTDWHQGFDAATDLMTTSNELSMLLSEMPTGKEKV